MSTSVLKELFVGVLLSAVASAQITQSYVFPITEGPPNGIIQGFDGSLYGTAYLDVFKFYANDFFSDTRLYFFCSQPGCSDGLGPTSGLIQASDGIFYGTTASGGVDGCICGTIFQITPEGTFTTLYRFNGPDGAYPGAGLVQGSDGNFYGTTFAGGTNGGGTIFRITSAGTLTVLYNFCAKSNCTDGANPKAELLQTANGLLYGTTSVGGTGNKGTVFKITSAGKLTTLHSFGGADGAVPLAKVIQARDGKFYGTASAGGAYGFGAIFKITSAGKLNTLYSFCAAGLPCPDGGAPYGGLVEGVNGTFFGTTFSGGKTQLGALGAGTIFGYVPSSGLTTMYVFGSVSGDGQNPVAGLTEGTGGNLYGTTQGGGVGVGIAFVIPSGDNPFVETNPASGKVGTAVTILGNNLTNTSKVTFGSKVATFSVVSASEIVVTVPPDARTGKVHVTTSGGKLLSRVPFRVVQ